MTRRRVLLLVFVFPFAARAACAVTAIFREQVIPSPPGGLVQLTTDAFGAAVWFTEFDANRIGMFSQDRKFREFVVPTPDSGPLGIVLGSDSIWFTEYKAGKIGKLTLDGRFTEYVIPSPQSAPWGIADIGGEIWFTESAANKIGRVNKDGSVTEFVIPTKNASPRGISRSPYNEPCFAEFGADQIGCLENGQIIERGVAPGSGPQEICRDGGAGIWFIESTGNRIGVASVNGVRSLAQARIQEFVIPTDASGPAGIVAEISGVWFTEKSAGQIGFLSYDGRITEYPLAGRSSEPTGISLSFRGAQFLESQANRLVEIQPDAVVVTGAGTTGSWETTLEVANVGPRPVSVFAGVYPKPTGISLGITLPGGGVNLPANGSGQIALGPSNAPGLSTLFVRDLEEGVLPVVRGRIYNRNLPSQSADLPTIRLSALTNLNPKTLTFPGALKNGSARSNLLIADASVDRLVIGPVQTTRVRVDLLDSAGFLIASSDFGFLGGGSIYLVDIVGRLGVSTFQDGQIRVTKLGDQGLLWGYLATIDADGAVSISSGVNP